MTGPKLSFREELQEVQELLRDDIGSELARYKDLVHLVTDELDDNACPGIILAVSKACGYKGKKAMTLAIIIQYIYLADKVHNLLRDDDNPAAELRQFPVLVGDFLFGKFFWGLSRAGLLDYLAPLAGVIVTLSKGAVNRWLTREQNLEIEEQLRILENGTASLTGLAARIGAELAGVSRSIQERCETFGRLMGLAWAARNEQIAKPVVGEILAQASALIKEISENLSGEHLLEVYDYIQTNLYPEALPD